MISIAVMHFMFLKSVSVNSASIGYLRTFKNLLLVSVPQFPVVRGG